MPLPPSPIAEYDPDAPRRRGASIGYRTGDLGDLETVAAMAHEVYGDVVEAWRQRMSEELARRDSCVLLAHAADRPVGYGKAAWREASSADPAPTGMYLTGLVVLSAWRRCGIGEELTRRRLNWVWQHGQTAWFFTNARNQASLALHRRLGFVEASRGSSFLGEPFDGGLGVLMRADPPRRNGSSMP